MFFSKTSFLITQHFAKTLFWHTVTLFVLRRKPRKHYKTGENNKNLDQFLTYNLDQFLTYKTGNLGPIFNFTAYIYIYIFFSLQDDPSEKDTRTRLLLSQTGGPVSGVSPQNDMEKHSGIWATTNRILENRPLNCRNLQNQFVNIGTQTFKNHTVTPLKTHTYTTPRSLILKCVVACAPAVKPQLTPPKCAQPMESGPSSVRPKHAMAPTHTHPKNTTEILPWT